MGCEVIDKRAEGGRLWVVLGEDAGPVLARAAGPGQSFTFVAGGGRATGRRPAWYLQTA